MEKTLFGISAYNAKTTFEEGETTLKGNPFWVFGASSGYIGSEKDCPSDETRIGFGFAFQVPAPGCPIPSACRLPKRKTFSSIPAETTPIVAQSMNGYFHARAQLRPPSEDR